jgi:hypothetical protein
VGQVCGGSTGFLPASSIVGANPENGAVRFFGSDFCESLRTAEEINSDPAMQLLFKYDLPLETRTRLWFDLRLMENFYPEWKGKLIIKWPPRDITFHRFADEYPFKITAIRPDSLLNEEPPASYRDFDLRWDELELLPESWKAKLRAWRGIYFIFDVSDGKGYMSGKPPARRTFSVDG